MNQEIDNFKFNLGQNVDVKDIKNKWVNGEIIYIKGFQVFIHYSGSSSRFDQYIDMRSGRLLPQWQPGKQLFIHNRIDAFHPSTGWIEGRVADIQYQPNTNHPVKIKIHYFNYHQKYDRWVDFNDNNYMSMIGSRSKAYGIGKTRLKKKSQNLTLNELMKKLLQGKIKTMIEQLEKQDYVMKNIQGDGNCLFRSVSDQLYGTQKYYRQIRLLCLTYINDEKAFFQDYVTQDIHSYVKRKSQDGVWGDDVEIQAISEIYGRPIQIYSTSSKPLRTFHQDNQGRVQPLRLAYVGFCHYNSIKKNNKKEIGLLESPFGEYQNLFTATYQQKDKNDNRDISRYRQFFSNSNGLDYALSENVQASENKEQYIGQSLKDFDIQQMNRALQMSQTENILDQIEKSEINQIKTILEKEQIQQQLRKIEQRQIQIAKQLSKKAKKDPILDQPYWFQNLIHQGFKQSEILFAIEINGYDPDLVQNFLFDNM